MALDKATIEAKEGSEDMDVPLEQLKLLGQIRDLLEEILAKP